MTPGCPQARALARAHPTTRRGLLQIGAAGVLGLSMADAGAASPPPGRKDTACIVLWLTGGPSQFDSFDPKPDAPAEIRGPFQPIATNVSGIRICEPFPLLARHADKYALLRSVHHELDHHALSMCWMLAGRLHDSIKYPTMGSVVSYLKPADPHIPSFVTVPRIFPIAGVPEVDHSQTAGDLGAAYDPVIPDGIPTRPDFGVRDLSPPGDVPPDRFRRREELLARVDPVRLDPGSAARTQAGSVYRRAFELIHSDRVRDAFAFEKEPEKLREAYGKNPFGQTTLLARRLVERGVRFVTVNWPSYYSWDHHGEIRGSMNSVSPTLDRAASALFEDLHQRGMLGSTLVLVMGEFGRTPKLNGTGGRDHWIQVMSVLMGGGGIRGGQVVGSSTPDGYPDERPVHAREMVATAYRALGIDTEAVMRTVGGRPIPVLPGVQPVHELL